MKISDDTISTTIIDLFNIKRGVCRDGLHKCMDRVFVLHCEMANSHEFHAIYHRSRTLCSYINCLRTTYEYVMSSLWCDLSDDRSAGVPLIKLYILRVLPYLEKSEFSVVSIRCQGEILSCISREVLCSIPIDECSTIPALWAV